MIGKDGWLVEGLEHECGNCDKIFTVKENDWILCDDCSNARSENRTNETRVNVWDSERARKAIKKKGLMK